MKFLAGKAFRRAAYLAFSALVFLVMTPRANAQSEAAAPAPADATAAPATANAAAGPAGATEPIAVDAPAAPAAPAAPGTAATQTSPQTGTSISLEIPDATKKPSQSVMIIIALTLLAVAPALLIMLTSFTRIAIVLSLTRNALGLQGIPPNQVIVGLALFLSIFVMSPTLSQINHDALQPLLDGKIESKEAYDKAVAPIRTFMLKQTRKDELKMFTSHESPETKPKSPDEVSLASLIPAFILSELKTAFIIGFIIFIPFLVIDIIVSSSLMSMGMMMLPPILVSLPFKLLLFVMVDGWALIVTSLITSFH